MNKDKVKGKVEQACAHELQPQLIAAHLTNENEVPGLVN